LAHKVINKFRDDDGTIYEVGDEYPKGDSKPTKKRIEELSQDHPKYRRFFIEEVKEKSNKKSKKDKE
jgi:hypothetical protein